MLGSNVCTTDGLILSTGRCARRLGLETCPRRSVPHASAPDAPFHYGWKWCSVVCNGKRDARYFLHVDARCSPSLSSLSICSPRFPFAFKSRFARYSHDDLLDVLRRVSVTVTLSAAQSAKCGLDASRIGGYFSSRVYASLGGTDRRKNALFTATLLPM